MADPCKDCGSAECLWGTAELVPQDMDTMTMMELPCLRRQLAAAKAELAILKSPGAKWYSYWHEDQNGYELHDTAEEARAAALDSIQAYRDEADERGEWSDAVEYVEWGLMVPHERAKAVPHEDEPDCYDYELAPLLDAAKEGT